MAIPGVSSTPEQAQVTSPSREVAVVASVLGSVQDYTHVAASKYYTRMMMVSNEAKC